MSTLEKHKLLKILLDLTIFMGQIVQLPPVITDISEKDHFFVITTIFNPASYQKRYDLYHTFAQHMNETGAQLITIECIFPNLNQHEFQVTEVSNPNHIQLKSESVYWIKENLINIAVSRLPAHAKWVCWLDADIRFDQATTWIDLTLQALENYTVVQMFETARFLSPNNQVLRTDYSFGYTIVHGKPIDQSKYSEWYPHPGYGWAMSVEAFRQMNGLPDFDIVGSGDLHFAFSLINRVSNSIEKNLSLEYREQIKGKASQTFNTVFKISKLESKGMTGYVPVQVNHLWHGSRKNRQYVNRWNILISHQYSQVKDTVRTSEGLLLFKQPLSNTSDLLKGHKPTLQDDIRQYFEERNEAENTVNNEDKNPFKANEPQSQFKMNYKVSSISKYGYCAKNGTVRCEAFTVVNECRLSMTSSNSTIDTGCS